MMGASHVFAGAAVSEIATQEPELLRLLSRLQDAAVRLNRLHENGQRTANMIFGSIPESVAGHGKGPASDGMMSMLHFVADALTGSITDCEGDMQRLQAL